MIVVAAVYIVGRCVMLLVQSTRTLEVLKIARTILGGFTIE